MDINTAKSIIKGAASAQYSKERFHTKGYIFRSGEIYRIIKGIQACPFYFIIIYGRKYDEIVD